jgi:hypothetical protein
MKKSTISLILAIAIFGVLAIGVGRVDVFAWLVGMAALAVNSIFVRRDIASRQVMRACFYATFGTSGILALLYTALLWASQIESTLSGGVRNLLLSFSSSGLLLIVVGATFAVGLLIGVVMNYNKSR